MEAREREPEVLLVGDSIIANIQLFDVSIHFL